MMLENGMEVPIIIFVVAVVLLFLFLLLFLLPSLSMRRASNLACRSLSRSLKGERKEKKTREDRSSTYRLLYQKSKVKVESTTEEECWNNRSKQKLILAGDYSYLFHVARIAKLKTAASTWLLGP